MPFFGHNLAWLVEYPSLDLTDWELGKMGLNWELGKMNDQITSHKLS